LTEHYAHQIRAAEKLRAGRRPDLTEALAEAARLSGAPQTLMVTTTAGLLRTLAWELEHEVAYSQRLVEQATDNAEQAARDRAARTNIQADRDRLADDLYQQIERLEERLAAAETPDAEQRVVLLRRYADDLQRDRDEARAAEERAHQRRRGVEESRDQWAAIARCRIRRVGEECLTSGTASAPNANNRVEFYEDNHNITNHSNWCSYWKEVQATGGAGGSAGGCPWLLLQILAVFLTAAGMTKLSWEQVQALDYAFSRRGAEAASSVVDQPQVGLEAVEAIAAAARRQRVMVGCVAGLVRFLLRREC
jgi:hypothetical protein